MHSYKKEDILEQLGTSNNGLTNIEAEERLKIYGKNELPKQKQDSIFKLFISQFKSPMELILVITVALSFLAGETIDAIALIFIILIDVLLGTYEEWKFNQHDKGYNKSFKR